MQLVAKPASRLWASYERALVRRPLLSRCLTGVVGAAVSDAAAQYGAHAASKRLSNKAAAAAGVAPASQWHYDWARTARLAMYSFALGTPLASAWFWWLDKAVMPGNPKSPLAVCAKIAADQLLMAPLGLSLFLTGMKVLEGKPQDVVSTIQEKLAPLLKANYMVWPVAHVINFGLIPSSQRILYINAVGVLWGTIMSHLAMARDAGGAGGARMKRIVGNVEEPLLEESVTAAAGPH